MFIYLIQNTLTGKAYVGQTRQTISQRMARHRWQSTRNSTNSPISLAIHKYGWENFTVTLLETCTTLEHLNEREVYWGNKLCTLAPNGYNLKLGQARGVVSIETRNKLSKAHKGRQATAEARANMSKAHKGKTMAPEVVEKLKDFYKGRQVALPTNFFVRKAFLVSPTGEIIEVQNFRKFCHVNSLQTSKMSLVINGKRNHHKGWRLYKNAR